MLSTCNCWFQASPPSIIHKLLQPFITMTILLWFTGLNAHVCMVSTLVFEIELWCCRYINLNDLLKFPKEHLEYHVWFFVPGSHIVVNGCLILLRSYYVKW